MGAASPIYIATTVSATFGGSPASHHLFPSHCRSRDRGLAEPYPSQVAAYALMICRPGSCLCYAVLAEGTTRVVGRTTPAHG
jgi:hypothetical protein